MQTETLLSLAEQRVQECYALVQRQLGKAYPLPLVSLKQRGKIAGSARLHQNEIRLNGRLFADNIDEFVTQVIPHEICHLLVFQQYGRVKPHGKEWRMLMSQLFGLQPLVTHSLDVTKVAGRHFRYWCDCGPMELSIRRHNKVLRGEQRYRCRRCQKELKAHPKTTV